MLRIFTAYRGISQIRLTRFEQLWNEDESSSVHRETVAFTMRVKPGLLEKQQRRVDFWSMQGDFIYRHHNEPRVQLFVPKEETFPILLKYIDVTRSTQTDLDVMQEKRIGKFTLLKSKRIHVVQGGRLIKIQSTARPDYVWPEVWTKNW